MVDLGGPVFARVGSAQPGPGVCEDSGPCRLFFGFLPEEKGYMSGKDRESR